eukprot:m.415621 g.415621  ORF g.415621 m.415621 type:complete len:339 (-) comp20177_c2_seq54:3526-4542(-)
MDNYNIVGRIGEGAHGVVFQATDTRTGQVVALKKVGLRRLEDGISVTALREISALRAIGEHQHVVTLLEVFPHSTGFVLVFEYMLSDLSEVMHNRWRPLTQAQVKSYTRMLLQGVAFCHENSIMHRDLKPANLLVSPSGLLKIADFGLARVFSDHKESLYSHQVATRWYRAPELLYGARKYNNSVDLWAVGCIFGEMLNNSPLFPGENDIDQLYQVLRVLGTPTQETWPEMHSLPDYNKITFQDMAGSSFEEIVPDAVPEALSLIQGFLKYSASQRITAAEALLHPYFFTHPLPAHHSELPIPPPRSSRMMPFATNIDLDGPLGLVKPELLPVCQLPT